ncbi:hypothetical protein FNU79_15085 [Deinococcus detaillensis]|uniref:Uncharacterized protein n=1 Tax=Deinococcus detaillensis TaxID=2592048 RepID=A0A553UMK3_9DEIO|nr:replication initiator protein A [Deinococcus detaillensis]TSA81452.1 hypothetical protein FNU79_15085 [Deinococcus detaillensis]
MLARSRARTLDHRDVHLPGGSEFSAEGGELRLGRSSELEIALAEPVVRSIRASYLKPLDYDFLRSLSQPLTRSLFRLLDARRYDPLNLINALPSLRAGLIERG